MGNLSVEVKETSYPANPKSLLRALRGTPASGAPQQAGDGYLAIVEVDCEEQRRITPLIEHRGAFGLLP